ncbi:hypothetical protein CDL15_Pgr006454 [Punica granatum]|uniref:Uncharacterized protein n=1 Tax=Punica granatum TaxID=22663 RepID=A0A218XYN8_PUNGR|nr:hypothetical protein CDL15_Pgr006454 [Punica granatum]
MVSSRWSHHGGLLMEQRDHTMAAQTGGMGGVGSSGCDSNPPLLLSVRRLGAPKWWWPPVPSRIPRSLYQAVRLVLMEELSCDCVVWVRLGSGQVVLDQDRVSS